MKTMKKFFLSGLISLCAGLFVTGAATVNAPVETASAEAAYKTVDVAAMAKITEVYVPNGNINLIVTLSETDVKDKANVTANATQIKEKLQAINFFDNI